MKPLPLVILLFPLLTLAADALAADAMDGARIFRQSCSVGYCHGSGGTAGRAPKLIGRAYQHEFAMKATRDGIPNTGMPGWKDRLKPAELDAVVAYVVRISGGQAQAGTGGATPCRRESPGVAAAGVDAEDPSAQPSARRPG